MSISQRFKESVDWLKLSQNEIGRRVGYSHTAIRRIYNQDSAPGGELIELFLSAFPEINPTWLVTGKGDMLLPADSTLAVAESQLTSRENWLGVPFYSGISAKATPGYLAFSDQPEVPEGYIKIPGMEDCTAALRVSGDSMYPSYNSGDIILCKEVQDRAFILWGEPYVVVTADGPILKRLKPDPSDDSRVMLISDNTAYDPVRLDSKKIRKLYRVQARVQLNAM